MAALNEIIVQRLIEIIRDTESLKVCDFGCGSGEVLDLLKKELPELKCTGIDFFTKYPVMKEKAEKLSDITFMDRGEITQELTAGFDLVFSTFALHHYQYPVKTLREINTLIKNGGYLVTIDFSFQNKSNGEIIKNISSFIEEMGFAVKGKYHRHHYTLQEAEDLLSVIPGKILLSEEFTYEESAEEKELQATKLKRNELIRNNIGKAPIFWQELWLPFFDHEHKLLQEFGHEYSALFIQLIKVDK